MTQPDNPSITENCCSSVMLMDGSGSSQSYAVIGRRGSIFLGIRLSGLINGARLGVPGSTYLHARLRSARNQQLAADLDLMSGADNVVDLFAEQLALDDAWPSLSFEKVDGKRASLAVGVFVHGSLTADAAKVVRRVAKGDLFGKLVDYAIQHCGAEHCIVDAGVASAWLFDQVKPALVSLMEANVHAQIMQKVQKQFQATISVHMETVGPHLQQLQTMYEGYPQA